MNNNKLKTYAPRARNNFIEAVTARAAKFGIADGSIATMEEQGGLVVIGGEAFPRKVGRQRQKLLERIQRHGFQQAMEEVAYTWFNRFVAIRYMELHGYLDHGYRVLSHPGGHEHPEILEHAEHLDFSGLNKDKVIDLKLDGTKDAELYRLLLIAQCNALHQALPFLFERVDDETELLLPDNLLQTDSLIRDLVTEILEEDWQEVEIIGWLYQFYISEKKDQVIGKVVKSEDIPAATQLFTPNWIVKYMVQNSLGAQWLATYPDSALKGQMEYYIEPAEQTDEVKAQLAAITPSTLNPEELTLIDPACGSGHILVEAYDLFKAIYLERGYRQRDVAQLILTKNLFGLDIDGRAAQLAGFALMMKGRVDDRRLFERGVKLNVMALLDSAGFDAKRLAEDVKLADYGLQTGDLTELKRLFEHATTFGSLIQVPEGLAAMLPALKQLSEMTGKDLFVSDALKSMGPLVRQTEVLTAQYDAVVANPPYMGSGGMNALVKKFTKERFPDAKADLFACFIERGYTLAKEVGYSAMITMQSWMFLSSFRKLREKMLSDKTICAMAQIGYNSFPTMNSKIAQATVFSLRNSSVEGYLGSFIDLNSAPQSADKNEVFLKRDAANRFEVKASDFGKIPGSPLSYWTSDEVRASFVDLDNIGRFFFSDGLTKTGDNEKYLRFHWEVAQLGNATESRYRVCAKGGKTRDFFGNTEIVVDWSDSARSHYTNDFVARITPKYLWDSSGISWTKISSLRPSFRWFGGNMIAETAGPTIFARKGEQEQLLWHALAFLSSVVGWSMLGSINPTLTLQTSDVLALPLIGSGQELSANLVRHLFVSAKSDWDAYERSQDFTLHPLIRAEWRKTSNRQKQLTIQHSTLATSYTAWITQNRIAITELKRLGEENNRFFINAYGLQDVTSHYSQVSLRNNRLPFISKALLK